MEQATEHANLAERFASDKSRLDLAWQHFHMAADCYLKAIEETQDEEAKRTLKLLFTSHTRQAKSAYRQLVTQQQQAAEHKAEEAEAEMELNLPRPLNSVNAEPFHQQPNKDPFERFWLNLESGISPTLAVTAESLLVTGKASGKSSGSSSLVRTTDQSALSQSSFLMPANSTLGQNSTSLTSMTTHAAAAAVSLNDSYWVIPEDGGGTGMSLLSSSSWVKQPPPGSTSTLQHPDNNSNKTREELILENEQLKLMLDQVTRQWELCRLENRQLRASLDRVQQGKPSHSASSASHPFTPLINTATGDGTGPLRTGERSPTAIHPNSTGSWMATASPNRSQRPASRSQAIRAQMQRQQRQLRSSRPEGGEEGADGS